MPIFAGWFPDILKDIMPGDCNLFVNTCNTWIKKTWFYSSFCEKSSHILIKLRLSLLTSDIADQCNLLLGWQVQLLHHGLQQNQLSKVQLFPFLIMKISETPPQNVLMETSKNLDLKRSTWSDYKHHNTLKIYTLSLHCSKFQYNFFV